MTVFKIPVQSDCRFETLANSRIVCYHPDSSEVNPMCSTGETEKRAYDSLLDEIFFKVEEDILRKQGKVL